MAKRRNAEYTLYEINGGYKNPSPHTLLMLKISKIDTSWFNFEEHGLYRNGSPFNNNKEEGHELTGRKQNIQTVHIPLGDGTYRTTRGPTLDGEGVKPK